MMDPKQLRNLVIKPVLISIGLHTDDAEELVFATACAESFCGKYIRQVVSNGVGKGLGIYQMEEDTAKDIYNNFFKYNPRIKELVETFRIGKLEVCDNLVCNLFYSTAMCRIHYLRVKQVIPDRHDLWAVANYWKKYYNTMLGSGTVEGFMEKWNKFK